MTPSDASSDGTRSREDRRGIELTRRTSPSFLKHVRYDMSLVSVVNGGDVEPESRRKRKKGRGGRESQPSRRVQSA